MEEEVETLIVRVRADRQGLSREVAAIRGDLEGPLAMGAERAGRRIEQGLLKAVQTGKIGFEDLKRTALSVLDGIAAAGLRSAVSGVGGGGGGGGLVALGSSFVTSALGLPGRATGGPVAAGRAYVVGERGPELFVPTASGRVETGLGAPREVRVNIAVQGRGGDSDSRLLARSARQVARAVKGALN